MEGQITKEGLARVLKQLRVNNNLTQQELADMLYCDIRQIRRYETEGTDKLAVVNLYALKFNINSLSILSQAQGAFWIFIGHLMSSHYFISSNIIWAVVWDYKRLNEYAYKNS